MTSLRPLKTKETPKQKLCSYMTRMCFESPNFRGREQEGKGWGPEDEGTGSRRAGYRRQEVLTTCPSPRYRASYNNSLVIFLVYALRLQCGHLVTVKEHSHIMFDLGWAGHSYYHGQSFPPNPLSRNLFLSQDFLRFNNSRWQQTISSQNTELPLTYACTAC